MTKHTILFLAANPLGTDRLALDDEARAIRVALERSTHRDSFELVVWSAARPLDLLDALRKLKPTVVHFSGHGGRIDRDRPRSDETPHRDIIAADHQDGLFFQGADGTPQSVSIAALEETFDAAGSSVKLVVLNACYSEAQVEALLLHVDCVVGMVGSIGDEAARSFAVGLYGGLGEGESISAAYRQGRAAVRLESSPDGERPLLKVRSGVDAEQIVLAEVNHKTTATENAGLPNRSAETQGESEKFDVFLCYNRADTKEVHRVAERLRDLDLNLWLDREQLRPGVPVARAVQEQISKIKAAAVFIGANGFGPWQEMEISALLEEFVRRGCRVIPVLLPGCPPDPILPSLLKLYNYVDLSEIDPDPIEQLYRGITDKKIGDTTDKKSRRRRRRLTWHSSIESVESGDVSALALAEILVATALFALFVWRFGPLLLLILDNWLRAALSVDSSYPLESLPRAYQRYDDKIAGIAHFPAREIISKIRNLKSNASSLHHSSSYLSL